MRVRPLAAVLIVAAVGGGVAWYAIERSSTVAPAKAASAPPSVPVVADVVKLQDVPIYLTGLGAVQAFNIVTVKVRVDGQIDKIAFTEGQHVKKGDVLAQIDPRTFQAQLAQAQANKARDEAQLANAELELTRFSSLATRAFATRESVDAQHAVVNQLQAAIQGDQAAIENAQVQLGYATITAPISGRTGMRLIDEGNIVHASDTTGLVVITQIKPISVVFTLPEDAFPNVSKAEAAGSVAVLAFSRDDKTKLGAGTLALIDNQIDQTTGTIRLKATFDNEDNALWPGQFVNVRLLLATRHNGVTVPGSVVQRGPQGTFAYVIKPDQTVEARPIKVAQIDQGVALIDDGLAADERVVVDGQYKLRPGARVEVNGPAATKPPAGTS